MNVSPMQTRRILHDLALEHAEDYAKKKRIVTARRQRQHF
jgi:hypothetical protein